MKNHVITSLRTLLLITIVLGCYVTGYAQTDGINVRERSSEVVSTSLSSKESNNLDAKIVATGTERVGSGYSAATVILRGWSLLKPNGNDMEIMDLGLAITDVKYEGGIVTWNIRMVTFSDGDAKDAIQFNYDYSVVVLRNGEAYNEQLEYPSFDKLHTTDTPVSRWLNPGYSNAMIFPTGFLLHIKPVVIDGTIRDRDAEISNFRFEFSNFQYRSGDGFASWNVITQFDDAGGYEYGYRWNFGYTIILTNGGQSFIQSSGIRSSTTFGSLPAVYNLNTTQEVVVAPVGWQMGYSSGDNNTGAIGTSIEDLVRKDKTIYWNYKSILHDQGPDEFTWSVKAGGMTFDGERIDGSYTGDPGYRFGIMRGSNDQVPGNDYDDGYTQPGTFIPFKAEMKTGKTRVGPLTSDRPPRTVLEDGGPTNPPDQNTSDVLRIQSVRVLDNAEGDIGKPFANWYAWLFPAEGFDYDRFITYLSSVDQGQYNHKMFKAAPHALNTRGVSTLLMGPYLSDSNGPEWGEEEEIGEQYLEYSNFPVWPWENNRWGDRAILFLWESDDCFWGFCAPDDNIAVYLVERGSSPTETFTTNQIAGGAGLLNGFGKHNIGSITFLNARSPGDIFVKKSMWGGYLSSGSWIDPCSTIREAVANAAAWHPVDKRVISIEHENYPEGITPTRPFVIDKPMTLRAHGGSVVIGK